MEKKLFYTIDNGDTPVTAELSGIMEMLKAEAEDYNEQKTEQDKPEWTITLRWLTDKEYEDLPEAY